MSNYYDEMQNATENFTKDLLCKCGINTERNNLINKTAVDLIANNKKTDVQFSQNFRRYGDIRIDVISAGFISKTSILDTEYNFLNDIQRSKQIKIQKPGKYFQKGYAKYIFYLLYDDKISLDVSKKLQKLPEGLLVLNVDEILEYIEKNNANFINRVIINDKRKNGIYENHISAFLPLSLKKELLNNLSTYSFYKLNTDNNYELKYGKSFKNIFS